MTKQLQNKEPFIIKNDKSICGMSSVLQCLLSLPNFLNSLNSQTKNPILNYFSQFMEDSHNTQDIKQYIETNSRKINFKDSFDFLNNFIDLIIKKKQEPDNMFHGKVSEIKECPSCQVPFEKDHVFFSSIELSFIQSLRILYVPYDLNDDPIFMPQIPNLSKNFVLMHQKNDEYFIIDDKKISPKYSNIYAFELPYYNKNNIIAIIQLNFTSDEEISSPFLCEMPLSQKNDKKNLQLIISKRIQNLFKSKTITIEIHNMVSKTEKYNQYNICLKPLQVTVTKYSKIANKREPQEEEEICLSLKEMFDSYISRSKLNDESECEYCHESNQFYFRKRLTKLPQILIFQIKKSEKKNSNQLIIPEFIYLDTGEFNEMDVMGNPNEYQNYKNIQKYELRAVSHSYKMNFNSLKSFSDVKRGSQWYRIKEDEVTSDGYRLKKPVSTADLLFYEIISNGSNNDDFKSRAQSPSGKIKIKYALDETEKTFIATFDRNQYQKATDIIKYFRIKYPNKEINGFSFEGRDYYNKDDTSFNEIFPQEISDIPIIKIIIGKPVSKPASKPSAPLRRPMKKPDILDSPNINISYSFIDNSSSMIACFKDSGERRSKVAVETIKRFLRAGQLYCSSDSFKFYENFKHPDKPEYNPDNFNDPSCLPDLLETITDKIIELKNYKNKRIFLVSDGVVILEEESGDKVKLMETYKKIVDNQIILDVVLLKSGTQISKELCAVSHMSGGYHFCPQNLNELFEFLEYESFVNLSKRPTINNAFQNYFNEKSFEDVSKNILSIPNSYKDNKFYPFLINASPLSEFGIKDDMKIEKEVYSCVYIQQKEDYFRIYRVTNQDGEIEKRRVSVFLQSKQRVVLQFDIFFPPDYPNEAPLFKLISNVEMHNDDIPNYFFRVQEKKYTKQTKLIDLINRLNKLLQSPNVEKDLKNVESPIKSLDQIETLFRTKFGPEEKDLDAYKDED